MEKSNGRIGKIISVMAVYFAANVIFVVNPPMQAFATQLYPNVSYSNVLLISTLSSLFMIPGSLISGAVLGKKISFKHMAILSLGSIIIAGILPYFIRNFAFVLVMRVIVGFGIGLGFPLQSTLAIKLFGEKERPGILGLGSFFMGGGGILYQIVSGAVCTMNAAYSWLVHGILIIPLIMVIIFLKEPVDEGDNVANQPLNEGMDKKSEGNKLPGMAIFTAFMFMIIFLAFYPILLNMSAIIVRENLGTSALAGTISSLFTLGGAAAGLMFAKTHKMAGKYTLPVGLALWVIGTGLFCIAHNIPMIIIAVVFCGLAVSTVWPGTMNDYSEYVPSSKISMASALFVSGMNLGCFLSSVLISMVANVTGNSDPRLPCIVGFIIVLIASIIWSVVEIKRKRD
ncbi:MFS transporter [Clostridium estertheticum]|nr:MFS transporter [Clostridium estertheticum]MCB2354609.1 MFS transporter [Clostridium estertheticum]WAG40857.1 MFS transporter [Clostridium estertheticum]